MKKRKMILFELEGTIMDAVSLEEDTELEIIRIDPKALGDNDETLRDYFDAFLKKNPTAHILEPEIKKLDTNAMKDFIAEVKAYRRESVRK